MTLRPYQSEAAKAAEYHLRRFVDPCLIEAATGAGKSHIIAHIAGWLHDISGGKRVLCLAPSKELIEQNHAKYLATGNPASIFSASAGSKSTRHPVVFGTPLTVKNAISRFKNNLCGVVIDEAHGITPTVREIIDALRESNENLRVIGTTATPYRMGTGYIFREWPDGRINGEDTCREPYFGKCVYRIAGPELIEQGYLTKPVVGAHIEGYDTSGLVLKPNGKFDDATVDAAFVGHGRKTASVVADVIEKSRGRKGVVFFAATVRHAHEIMASLPPQLSAIITGTTQGRDKILKRFDQQEIKYLVNVGVLTTGWDCTHVDVIAILRRTESVGLLQQIIGRGLRLHEGKRDCIILDYADNIDTHCPDGDLFRPVVKSKSASTGNGAVIAQCPDCGYENEFNRHKDAIGYQLDRSGYCIDTFGDQIQTEHGPMPGHYGRRCFGVVKIGADYERCSYRWTSKECPTCGEGNDIAARYCHSCKGEIVDPNAKLAMEFAAFKKDPTKTQTDEVVKVDFRHGVSAKGNETVRADWVTPWRHFSTWHLPHASFSKGKKDWERFALATHNATVPPKTISYVKDGDFFRILAFDMDADCAPA